MTDTDGNGTTNPSAEIDRIIAGLGDWCDETLGRIRASVSRNRKGK